MLPGAPTAVATRLWLLHVVAAVTLERRNNLDKTPAAGEPRARSRPQGHAEPGMDAPPDEPALMTAYARGDEGSFAPLFRALAPRLLGFFRRSGLPHPLCEDLVQATFVRLHVARHRYRPGAPVRPWLFTIAARVRVDHLRKLKRHPASDADIESLEAPQEALNPDRDQRARSVRDALDELPASLRVVVHLHRFEGLSFPEIGKVLGISAGAARVRAFRAYEILRERLRPLVAEEQ